MPSIAARCHVRRGGTCVRSPFACRRRSHRRWHHGFVPGRGHRDGVRHDGGGEHGAKYPEVPRETPSPSPLRAATGAPTPGVDTPRPDLPIGETRGALRLADCAAPCPAPASRIAASARRPAPATGRHRSSPRRRARSTHAATAARPHGEPPADGVGARLSRAEVDPRRSPRDAGRGRRRTSASLSSVSPERGSGRLRPRSPALPAGPSRGAESAAQPPSATILPARTPQRPQSAAHRGAHRAAPLRGRRSRGAGRDPGAPGPRRRESAPPAAPVGEPDPGTPPNATDHVPPSDARQVHRPARRRTRAEPGPGSRRRHLAPPTRPTCRTSAQSCSAPTPRSANTGSADTRERRGRGRRARLPSAPRSDIGSGGVRRRGGGRARRCHRDRPTSRFIRRAYQISPSPRSSSDAATAIVSRVETIRG
ncbi:Uncharacterised protein (plasmid) [Tsukamurella tyrosinosolvens]|uniref:Uncharacterized protein n=1 Tax=Tsukamurella tyrosinosolvens TaxID=57704 RepID=A0A1H4IDA1_TSUTY|nr:hypothetical protein SAMN04489793_0274 [Tsukamurella tyrosinosolvens]VEH94935.1 Uncharacterised protein [Tsukamurella tyrosinosolvens]